jgi:hypothetical protein
MDEKSKGFTFIYMIKFFKFWNKFFLEIGIFETNLLLIKKKIIKIRSVIPQIWISENVLIGNFQFYQRFGVRGRPAFRNNRNIMFLKTHISGTTERIFIIFFWFIILKINFSKSVNFWKILFEHNILLLLFIHFKLEDLLKFQNTGTSQW